MGESVQRKNKTPGSKGKHFVTKTQKSVFPKTESSPAQQILHLQRTIGNREVQRLIKSGSLQASLTIGKPNDKYEIEADRVADRVMRMPENKGSLVQKQAACPECPEKEEIQTKPLADQITPLVQRQVEPEEEEEIQAKLQRQTEEEEEEELQPQLQRQTEEEEEETLQAKPGNNRTPAVTSTIESGINSLRGGGQPLPESTRSFFEPRFGADFSQVRLHIDTKAAEAAKSINAKAFTRGRDVVFGAGQYSPGTSSGKRLLSHELTHVVQQGSSTQKINLKGLTEEEKKEDLKSPRFAKNQRLQRAFDNDPCILWGETGEAVAIIQQGLIDNGFPMPISTNNGKKPPDGIFKNETYKTVRKFKKKYGLDKDGIVGRETLGKLDKMFSSKSPSIALPPIKIEIPPPQKFPIPETQDCLPWQKEMLIKHLTFARTWVNDAESKIKAFKNRTASKGIEAIVRDALKDNFHTIKADDVATIADDFTSLKKALSEEFNYECASDYWCEDPNELAYVRGRFGFIRRMYDVNICKKWFKCRNFYKRVSTLIHERAHQYPGATDNAYEFEASYSKLSASDAIDNADSYAVAARQIYHTGARGPGITC